jgi:hypothetical protein
MSRRATVLAAALGVAGLVVSGGGASAATKTCKANGRALQITAEDNKFDKDCMAVPTDQAFTISLENKDQGVPHNVSLYDTAHGNKALYQGEIIYGPSKITYQVPGQAKGTYEFISDPQAEIMRGTFIVG